MASTFFRSVRSLEADNSRRSYLALALAASLLALWIVWFFLARVSVYAVTNKAELEVDRAAHPVESVVSGRVVATHLVLDQEVKAGDVLVELDSGAQQFQLTEEKTQLAGANPQIHSREEEIASEEQALVQDQQASKDALEEARAHYREAEAAAQFAQAESERIRKMYNAGVVAELDLNRSVADAQQRRAAADSQRYAVDRLEGEQRTRSNERRAHIEQLTSELNKLRGDRATAAVTMERLEEEVDRRYIRAPIDGRLGEVAPLRIGAVVHEGDKLAAVIPAGGGELRSAGGSGPHTGGATCASAAGRFSLGAIWKRHGHRHQRGQRDSRWQHPCGNGARCQFRLSYSSSARAAGLG